MIPISYWILVVFCHSAHSKSPKPQKPREKQKRIWENAGSSAKELDYSNRNGGGSPDDGEKIPEGQIDLVCSPPLPPPKEVIWSRNICISHMNNVGLKVLGCILGEAAELHEGRPAVCRLRVQRGRGDGGGRWGSARQENKWGKVGKCIFCCMKHTELLDRFT